MITNWSACKNILCIRPDNMGDLIMTGPAIRALKKTFGAHITVLTSSMAKAVIPHMPEIDDAIIYDLPWVKTNTVPDTSQFNEVVEIIRQRKFDAAVVFTVYSQNPLPTAMLAYLAGIPNILAYCRENPYGLITNWVPDKEPYDLIKHQVQRDLDLVRTIGADTVDKSLSLSINHNLWQAVSAKLTSIGFDIGKRWIILHAGVSEKKREYSIHSWISTAKRLLMQGYQVLFTGSSSEKILTDHLQQQTGAGSFSIAGVFNLEEFICLVKNAPCMVSVNTGTTHIAAAVATPVVVLYAQTNPQHTPWNVPCKVLPFGVPAELQSKNQVIAYVSNKMYNEAVEMPGPDDIIKAVDELMAKPGSPTQPFPEIPNESRAK
jgi:lipopolysaccharide heptosyltransferase II